MKKVAGLVVGIVMTVGGYAQYRTQAQQLVLSNEDSLNAGISSSKTVLSGYGSAFYQRDFNKKESVLNLERAVLFVGHQFNNKISVFLCHHK